VSQTDAPFRQKISHTESSHCHLSFLRAVAMVLQARLIDAASCSTVFPHAGPLSFDAALVVVAGEEHDLAPIL